LATHFSGQFGSCHPWHRVVRYQKISSQSTFQKPQRLYGGVRFNHLMSEVFQ
jgi:alkylated DNA nucleotide flippase Atl1